MINRDNLEYSSHPITQSSTIGFAGNALPDISVLKRNTINTTAERLEDQYSSRLAHLLKICPPTAQLGNIGGAIQTCGFAQEPFLATAIFEFNGTQTQW